MKLRLALAVCLVGSAGVCLADGRATDATMENPAGFTHSAHAPLYEGLAALPGGAGCCESPFNCCQDVWDGYCDEQRTCHRCGHSASGPLCWLKCRKHRDRHARQDCCPSQCGTSDRQHGDVVEVLVSETVMPSAPACPAEPRSLHKARCCKATRTKGHCLTPSMSKIRR
ncbi:MAG: hypothetical protein WD847_06035 [Pirellulales bacterium]